MTSARTIRSLLPLSLVVTGTVAMLAQGQPREPNRTPGIQGGQDPNRTAFLAANCKNPPAPPAAPGGGAGRAGGGAGRGGGGRGGAPESTQDYVITEIPGVVAGGLRWKLLHEEPGNNADGIVAFDAESVLVAQNDKSTVLRVDLNGRTSVAYTDTYTGGALAANARGQLFVAERALGLAIWLLAPERRLFANTMNGEPLDCIGGGALNDVVADNKGGVYFSMGGIYYANARGVVSGRYGTVGGGGGGMTMSPDEKTFYATGRPGVVGGGGMVAFDVGADGSLTNERVFVDVGNDGTTIDAAGRIYTVRQDGVVVISPEGKVLGVIGAPRLFVSLAFGGPGKKTLFAAASRDAQVMAIPMIAQGNLGRPK